MNGTSETGGCLNNEMSGFPSNGKNDYYENNGYWNNVIDAYQNNVKNDSANYENNVSLNNEKNDSLN